MNREIQDEKAIRKYLLGELAPDEQERLEERLLDDNDYFQQLLIVEDDLIDDYVGGELSSDERLRFDNYFLAAPERGRDLRFARALRKYVSSSAVENSPAKAESPPRQNSLLSSFWAALRPQIPLVGFSLVAMLLLTAGGLWLFNRQSRQQSQPGSAQTEPANPPQIAQQPQVNNQPADNTQLADKGQANSNQGLANSTGQQPPPTPKTEKPKATAFAFTLSSGITRGGGEMKRVEIPRDAERVQLRLELDAGADDYQSYQAVLQTGAEREILKTSRLGASATAKGKIVVLEVPATLLKREDYYLKLSGQNAAGQVESVGTYSFRVIE
jgi:hypothetical protein